MTISATRPEIVTCRRSVVYAKKKDIAALVATTPGFFPCTQGISTDENSDVAIESSDDGMSEYGRDKDYTPLVCPTHIR